MEIIAAALLLSAAIIYSSGRRRDRQIVHWGERASHIQADAIAKIADLIDRELPSGYRDLNKARERHEESKWK
jgi:hypothetical protein